MNIGEVANSSGVSAKLIRHYESIGLIPKAQRNESGYRSYKNSDVQFLKFIKKARGLGFSMKEIKTLLNLWRNKSRKSSEVKKLTDQHISMLETKISEMQEMVAQLKAMSEDCNGNESSECSIINKLEGKL